MNSGATVWLPYHRSQIPGLPRSLSYGYWDGSDALPGDPAAVRFLVGPPVPGAERALRPLLPRTTGLEVLQLLSSGHDHMTPLLDTLAPGTRLATGRGVHREATAELALTLLLALSRGLDRFARSQAEGRWRPEIRPTLTGKRVLVIGQGAVGTSVATLLGALRCEVVRVARTGRSTASGPVHGAAELPALLPTADAVVLCAPLTEETRGMFDADALALLKRGCLVVNVARGELVDTEAMVRAVRDERIRVALDVTDPEPLPAGHPLWSLPGVLITPHVAAFTDAFPGMSMDFLRRQLHRYARGEALHNVVHTASRTEDGERAA